MSQREEREGRERTVRKKKWQNEWMRDEKEGRLPEAWKGRNGSPIHCVRVSGRKLVQEKNEANF